VRAINDLQVTVDQSLHAILTAELAGDAAWQWRIQLVRQRRKLSNFC
jgi:hypothetical protein